MTTISKGRPSHKPRIRSYLCAIAVSSLKLFPFTFSWGYSTISEHYGAWLTWCYPKSFDSGICQIWDMVGQWLLVSRPLQVVPYLNVILLILRNSKHFHNRMKALFNLVEISDQLKTEVGSISANNKLQVKYNSRVAKVHDHEVTTENGDVYPYDYLVFASG